MYYETMPLYPALRPGCDRESCVRVPMFDGNRCPPCPDGELRQCRRVTMENPCCPGERAEVLLGLDACGNLVVCVRRDPPRDCDREPCRPRPRPNRCLPESCCPPPRPRCGGRLYGTWR